MFELDAQQVLHVRPFLSVTTGIVVLFVGKALNQRFALLREYNIPEPVTGGLLFSVAFGLAYLVSGVKLDFELSARDILLVYFFTVIGINARVGDLAQGGKPLLALLAVTVAFMLAQNLVGVGAARLLGLDPSVGLLAGSISMTGGHGTAIAWAPVIAEERGVTNAMEIGVVCATMGLVLASLAGGPVARYLIQRHRLEAPRRKGSTSVCSSRPSARGSTTSRSSARSSRSTSPGSSGCCQPVARSLGVKVPLFVPCLPAGILLTNVLPRVAPKVDWPAHRGARAHRRGVARRVSRDVADEHAALDARRSLRPACSAARAAARRRSSSPSSFVPALGRGYDAAVTAAGFVGFSLGATPTAMANMTAVTQRYGASQIAFLIVPLVGAFFIDVANALVIRMFLAAM